MKIGIFSESYKPYISGLVTSEVMLKEGLERLGHTVYVVSINLESFKYKYDEEEHLLLIPGIPIGIYDSRQTTIYPTQAAKIIKKWDLDVIHSQTEFAIGTFARLFAKRYNIPLVHTYHTMYEDYVYYITHGIFNKQAKQAVKYIAKFYCETTATELIVPTEKMYKLFKEQYDYKKNIHIIPTGIDIERFYKENLDTKSIEELKKSLNINKNDFVIIFVGRLGKEKNVEFLLEAHAELIKKNKNIKLLIVGDGPDKSNYLEIINKLKIKDNVLLVGKVKWEEIPYYYQVSNLFATASTTETQGLTIIEAMASSLCPLCIEDEAFKSMITDNITGIFFKDKKDYIEKVLYLIKEKEIRKKLESQSRVQSEQYSTTTYAKKVYQVYLNSIKEKRKEDRFGIVSKIDKKIRRDLL